MSIGTQKFFHTLRNRGPIRLKTGGQVSSSPVTDRRGEQTVKHYVAALSWLKEDPVQAPRARDRRGRTCRVS
jgi:hypothetical protein